jgi:hypothetical protein
MMPFPRKGTDEGFIQASSVKSPVMFNDAEFGTATWLPTVPGKLAA